MSILDEVNISKSHNDVQSTFVEQADVEETFEHMLIIRVKMRVPIDDYKSSMDKGRLIQRYYEDVIPALDVFKCIKTTFMVNVNSITNIVCTTSIHIGWNEQINNFDVMRLIVLIGTATLHFKPKENEVTLTIKNIDGSGESNNISIIEVFQYEYNLFILKKFGVEETYLNLFYRQRFKRAIFMIKEYFEKHYLRHKDFPEPPRYIT